MRSVVCWPALLVVLMALGCSQGEELGKIHGTVTFQNEPIKRGLVMFANKERGVYMTAPISEEGMYEVQMAKGPGLPLGKYDVAVAPPLLDHPIGPILNPPKLEDEPQFPAKYRSYETSGLSVTINSGDNVLDIDLKPDAN
jgi:hypothetical protein